MATPFIVTAIHTFVAEHSDELEFTAGERIEIIEKDDAFGDGWWKGRNEKGDLGLFPATYISDEAITGGGAANPTGAETDSRSGSPIPVPPSPKAAVTPPPTTGPTNGTSATAATNGNGLASPFVQPAQDAVAVAEPSRNSLLDITGQPLSTPSVVAATATTAASQNVMGSTIGQVQEAIDTMGASGAPSANASPNLPKVAQLKDPQSPAAAVLADDDDDAPPSSIGIASDARARLAEQAKLANEERDRQQQRDSGAIADLVYSDESDDEDYSPTSPRRSLTNANGPNGHSHGAVGLGSSPLAHQDVATPVVSPTTATHATASNEATPKALSESVAASTTEPQAPAGEGLAAAPVTALAAQAAPTSPPTSPPAAAPAALTSAQEPAAPSSAPIVPAAAVVTRAAAAPAVAAVASTHSRSVSGASDALPRGAANPTSPATRTVETPGDATSVQSSSKRPAQWTVDEVVEWARSKGFDEAVCAKFIEHEISGDILLEMDANMLKEIDIPQFGKRVRISTAISELRRPSSALSSASPAPPEHGVLPGVVGGMRTFSAPPASYSSSSPVVDDASWGHGRKVSMTPSTPAIDEVPAGVNGSRSPSHPVSPAYAAAAGVAAGAAGAAAVSPLSKRDSSSSLGHKKKGSMDKTDRLSFFGRARKPAPMPGPQSHGHGGAAGAVRSAFGGKPTTTIAAAQPERRISGGGATVAIGSALRTIGSPDKSGYLKKRGDRYNTWKTRFFVLKGSHLYYLKSESEDRVKGRIDLKGHRIMFEGQQSAGGSYGFSLVGPNDKTHSFSAPEQSTIRDWMKALMKATIARDYTVPVTSSCNIPTIPLAEAQALQPRPPSPSQIDATQRANRRENVNQLTARDASVLMSLDTSRRLTSHGSSTTPTRPSRDTRRTSTSKNSTANSAGRPSIARTSYPPENKDHADLLMWVNTVLPAEYPRAAYFPNSFISGEVIFLLVKHLSGLEPAAPLSPDAFSRDANGQPNVEGLFAMMDCVIDAGIDSAGVSLNEVRAGDANAIATLLESVRSWARSQGLVTA